MVGEGIFLAGGFAFPIDNALWVIEYVADFCSFSQCLHFC